MRRRTRPAGPARSRACATRADVVDRELEPGAHRRVEPSAADARSSGPATRKLPRLRRRAVSKRRVYWSTRPRPRAHGPASMIAATAAADRIAARAPARAARRRARRRRRRAEREQLRPHRHAPAARRSPRAFSLWATGLAISRAVQRAISSRTTSPFSRKRGAGGGQVDDPLGEAGQRRQLDRALDLDDLRLAAGVDEVPRRDPRILGRDPDDAEPPQRLGRAILAGGGREHHRARAVAEVEQLVHLALGLLDQHVLAGDADVGGSGLDIGRHVATVASSRFRRRRTAACDRSRGRRACRTPSRSSRSSVSPNSAPRGTAIRSAVHRPLLARQRDVHALDVQREPDCRLRLAEVRRAARRSARRCRSARRGRGHRPGTRRRCSSRGSAPARGRRSRGPRPRARATACTARIPVTASSSAPESPSSTSGPPRICGTRRSSSDCSSGQRAGRGSRARAPTKSPATSSARIRSWRLGIRRRPPRAARDTGTRRRTRSR